MRPECTLALAGSEPSLKNLTTFAGLSVLFSVGGGGEGVVVPDVSVEDSLLSEIAVKQASVHPMARCF